MGIERHGRRERERRGSRNAARCGLLACCIAACVAGRAYADDPETLLWEQQRAAEAAAEDSWSERETATGSWFGARPALAERGVEVFGGYTVDVLGNTTGGEKRSAVAAGLLDLGLQADLERLVGWPGGAFRAAVFHLTGDDASQLLVGNLFTLSNIAGPSGWRLYELWLEQSFFEGRLAIQGGQLATDAEFAASEHAALFVDSTFGWPAFLAANLPPGASAFPMGTAGARVAFAPAPWIMVDAAVLEGDPLLQDTDASGFEWDPDEDAGTFLVNELHLRWNQEDVAAGGAGELGVGLWYHWWDFPSPDPLRDDEYSGNYGVYAVVDQMLWREDAMAAAGDPAVGHQGLAGFVRVAGSAYDRSVVGAYADAGLTYRGLFPTRDDDVFGVAFAYARITRAARSAIAFDGLDPARGEWLVEATYEARLLPWLSLQPDLQVVIDPGATTSRSTAVVVGMRAAITF